VDRASEDDFAAYVGLRWQPLVRTLVLLGCPTDRAEQVTRTALSRVHRSWARVRRAEDVDVQVFRRLLHTWPETRRRHTRRTALVLHTVGGLTEAQVGAVLGSGAVAVGDHLDEDDPLGLLGRRPDDVEVGPPPLEAIVAGSARARGVRRRVLLTALAVVTLVAAVTVVVVVSRNGPAGPSPSPAGPASRAVKQASVPYLADGVLHVGRLTRPVRPVTDLVDPGVGAVYRSDEADVVLVDAQGGTAEIGHNAAPGLAADAKRGWVFWLTYNQQLVVFDARHGLPVRTRLAIEPIDSFRFARPLALTDGTAYYLTRRTVRAWDVARNRVTTAGSDRSLVFLARSGDLVVSPARYSVGIVATRGGKRLWRRAGLTATRAVLSTDGSRVLLVDASAHPVLLDALTGEELPTGLPALTQVTGIGFTRDGGAAYAERREGNRSALVECRGSPPRCDTVATVTGLLTVAP
jgi:hypothetical protein